MTNSFWFFAFFPFCPLLNIYKLYSLPPPPSLAHAPLLLPCDIYCWHDFGQLRSAALSCAVLSSSCLRLFAAALGRGNRLASWAQPQIALGLGLAVAAARGSSQCHLQAATWRKLLVTLDTRLLEPRAAATFFCRRFALFVQLLD